MRQTFLTSVAAAALAFGLAQSGAVMAQSAATPGAEPQRPAAQGDRSNSSGSMRSDEKLPTERRTTQERTQQPGSGAQSGPQSTQAQQPGQSATGAQSTQQQQQKLPQSGSAQSGSQSGTQSGTAQGSQSGTAQSGSQTGTQSGTAQTGSQSGTQGGTTLSGSQTQAPDRSPATAQGRSGAAQQGAAQLQPDQENRIRETLATRRTESETNVNFNVSVGATVPQTVRFQPLPRDIVSIVPQYRNYHYVVVRDEIVIVEPKTRRVVHVIDRSGRSATGSINRTKISLEEKERMVIKRNARQAYTGKAPASLQVRIGQRVPENVELDMMPDMIVSEVPEIRTYRYFVIGDEIVLVEPQTREVVEIVR